MVYFFNIRRIYLCKKGNSIEKLVKIFFAVKQSYKIKLNIHFIWQFRNSTFVKLTLLYYICIGNDQLKWKN